MVKILLYDDDEGRTMFIAQLLIDHGYDVQIADELLKAQLMVTHYSPDVVVVDAPIACAIAMINYCTRVPIVCTGQEGLAAKREGRAPIVYAGAGDMALEIPAAIVRALEQATPDV